MKEKKMQEVNFDVYISINLNPKQGQNCATRRTHFYCPSFQCSAPGAEQIRGGGQMPL